MRSSAAVAFGDDGEQSDGEQTASEYWQSAISSTDMTKAVTASPAFLPRPPFFDERPLGGAPGTRPSLDGIGPSQHLKCTVLRRPVPVSSQRWPPTSKTSATRDSAWTSSVFFVSATESPSAPSSGSISVRV